MLINITTNSGGEIFTIPLTIILLFIVVIIGCCINVLQRKMRQGLTRSKEIMEDSLVTSKLALENQDNQIGIEAMKRLSDLTVESTEVRCKFSYLSKSIRTLIYTEIGIGVIMFLIILSDII